MAVKIKEKLGTVCPKCGTVYKNGTKYAQAWGLTSWIRQGYIVEVCQDCKSGGSNNAN